MKLTRWFPWLALVIALGAFGLWQRFIHDPFVRKVATLERSDDSLNRELVKLRADSVSMATEDKHLRASRAALLLKVNTKPRIDTLIVQADSAVAEVVKELPDSLKPKMWGAVARKDSIIAELLSDRANLLGIVVLMDRQISLRDTALAHTRFALAAAIQERDAWRKIAKPSFGVRLLHDIPKVATGVALILVAKAIH